MKKIVVAKMPLRKKNALVSVLYEDGRPSECFARSADAKAEEGSIFTGIVDKVDKHLNAAFVRLGEQKHGYLPLEKTENIIFCGAKNGNEIKPQDRVIVMVEKAAVKTKHCVLTGDLSISGRYMVIFFDRKNRISFSNKLSADRTKELKKAARGLNGNYSLLFRTLCEDADFSAVSAEYERLCGMMDHIVKYGTSRPYGTCLFGNGSPEELMIKKTAVYELDEIVTDSAEVYEELSGKCVLYDIPREKLRLYGDPMIDLYKLYNFTALIDRLTKPEVYLKSGASLKIEMTEAFVVIDVNSSNSAKKYKKSGSFLPLNLEAADEIAAQIRLRQLSGIILIDFINMDSAQDEKALAAHMKELFLKDPVRTSYVDITKLGIMEVTREKRYKNINEQLVTIS